MSNFKIVGVIYINRADNGDAHQLVGVGKSLGSRTWTGYIPTVSLVSCNSFSVAV